MSSRVSPKFSASSVSTGADQHKSTEEIRAGSKQAKEKKSRKSSVIRVHSVEYQTGNVTH